MKPFKRSAFLMFLTVVICGAQVTVSPTSLSFTVVAGGELAQPQRIAVASTIAGIAVTFSVLGDGGAPGIEAPPWLIFRPRTLTTPATIHVSVDPSGLTAGTSATVHLVLTNPAGVAIAPVIPISVNVVAGPPKLIVVPGVLRLSSIMGGNIPRFIEQFLAVRNDGPGGLAPVAVSLKTPSSWLSVSLIEPCDEECLVRVSADRSPLLPGSYRAVIQVTTAIGSKEIPVSMFMGKADPMLALQPAAVRFDGAAGKRDVSIFNLGTSPADWTAQVEKGGAWLTLLASSGVSTAESPGTLSLQVNASSGGAPYALIKISSPQAQNSPLYLPVMLRTSGMPAVALPEPAGLVLTAAEGTAALPETPIAVSTNNTSPALYYASVQLVDSTGWLSLSPTVGSTSSSSPATAYITALPVGLSRGVYRGKLNFAMGHGNLAIRSMNITFIVSSGPACAPSQLSATHLSLVDNFSVEVGSYVPLLVRLVNDCGQPVTNGSVAVEFSNGDQSINLQHLGDGIYSGVWSPRQASPWASVTAIGSVSSSALAAKAEQVGSVTSPALGNPILASSGTLNNLNPLIGGPLAPGTVVQIFGSKLATSTAQPGLSPQGQLPTTFNGTTIRIGDYKAPMYFLSDGQLNAELPMELPADNQQQIIVEVNGAFSLADTLNMTAVHPGVAVFSNGVAIAQADATLVDENNPAYPGQDIVIYLVGMGLTTPRVGTGVQTPMSLFHTDEQPQVTIDEQPAQVAYAGLTPQSVGLYQINVKVPPNARTGKLKLVITQGTAVANECYLVVQ